MRVPRKIIQDTKDLIKKFSGIKLIHYRDEYQDINNRNFFIATKVDFKKIPRKNRGILKKWEQIKRLNIVYQYKSGSGSEYIVDNKENVYRLADHWGAVSGCEWTIEGGGNLCQSFFITGPLEIGIANISEFELFFRKISPKKDYIVNPVWKKEIKDLRRVVQRLQRCKDNVDFKKLPICDKQLIGENFGNFQHELQYVRKPINREINLNIKL